MTESPDPVAIVRAREQRKTEEQMRLVLQDLKENITYKLQRIPEAMRDNNYEGGQTMAVKVGSERRGFWRRRRRVFEYRVVWRATLSLFVTHKGEVVSIWYGNRDRQPEIITLEQILDVRDLENLNGRLDNLLV